MSIPRLTQAFQVLTNFRISRYFRGVGMQFAEHVKILVLVLLVFSVVFVVAYTLGDD